MSELNQEQVSKFKEQLARLIYKVSALEQSEELFRTAALGSLDAWLILRPVSDAKGAVVDFTFAEVNGRAEKLMRRPWNELVGSLFSETFPSGQARAFFEIYKGVYESGKPTEAEVFVDTVDGLGLGWLHYQVTPMSEGVAVTFRDVSSIKQSERALAASEANYREIFHKMDDGLLVVDQETRKIDDANQKAYELFSRSVGQLVGQDIDEVTFGATSKFTGTSLEAAAFLEFSFIDPSGKTLWAALNVKQATIAGKSRMLVLIRDVSERKRLEEQFRQAQRMEVFGRLAGGIAHDFNNLISIVQGRAEILSEIPLIKSHREILNNIDEIKRTTERATALTRNLLAFSRMQMLQRRILDLNQLISDLGRMLEALVGAQISLQLDLAPGALTLRANPSQLEQVILNLVGNARDAMPSGGVLKISTASAKDGKEVVLKVQDTGIGMDPDTQSQIFEPFFTTKAREKGTGLGLSTVYGIVKQYDGRIALESAPNQGTCFTISFPAEKGEVTGDAQVDERVEPGRGVETVLVVEDNDGVRSLIKDMLEESGYRVVSCSVPSEALEACQRGSPKIDLAVLDVLMPEMTGPELARKIKQLSPQIKVLFVSAYSDGALEHSSHFLQKPFRKAELISSVQRVIASKK